MLVIFPSIGWYRVPTYCTFISQQKKFKIDQINFFTNVQYVKTAINKKSKEYIKKIGRDCTNYEQILLALTVIFSTVLRKYIIGTVIALTSKVPIPYHYLIVSIYSFHQQV